MKSFIVFKGAKRAAEALNKEFQRNCIVASSENGLMITDLTKQWTERILGRLSFRRRLLAWDTYHCHLEESVENSLEKKKVDVALVPGGYTRYIQAPGASWYRPFKQLYRNVWRVAVNGWHSRGNGVR